MLYPWLVPHIIFPLYDLLSGTRTWSKLRKAQRSQWLAPDELQARTLAKLQAILSHASARVPFYGELFQQCGFDPAAIKEPGDLARVPILTRQEVRNNFADKLLAQGIPAKRRRVSYTSGSSGFPLGFHKDKQAESQSRALLLLFWEWAGVRPWDAMLWLEHPERFKEFYNQNPLPMRIARRLFLGESMSLSAGPSFQLPDFKAWLGRFSASRQYWLFSFPSYLGRLANQILEEKLSLPRPPKAIISYAETLTPENELHIKEAFKCPVTNFYTTREVRFLAQNCPDNPSLMHVNAENVVLRVVDQQGQDLPAGQLGRVLLTDLHNRVMPLINYDVGDLAVKGPPCTCGRGFATLQRVEGRVSELLYTADGRTIAPSVFGRFLFKSRDYMPYIWEYQVQQEAMDRVTLLVVPTDRFTTQTQADLIADLRGFLGEQMEIAVAIVAEIPAEKSGKRPVIKSLIGEGGKAVDQTKQG